jgi:hypothetical protein
MSVIPKESPISQMTKKGPREPLVHWLNGSLFFWKFSSKNVNRVPDISDDKEFPQIPEIN